VAGAVLIEGSPRLQQFAGSRSGSGEARGLGQALSSGGAQALTWRAAQPSPSSNPAGRTAFGPREMRPVLPASNP